MHRTVFSFWATLVASVTLLRLLSNNYDIIHVDGTFLCLLYLIVSILTLVYSRSCLRNNMEVHYKTLTLLGVVFVCFSHEFCPVLQQVI